MSKLRELINAFRYVNEHVPSSPAKDTMLADMGKKIDDAIRSRTISIIGVTIDDNQIAQLKNLFMDVCR